MAESTGLLLKHGFVGSVTNHDSRMGCLFIFAEFTASTTDMPFEEVWESDFFKFMREQYEKDMSFFEYMAIRNYEAMEPLMNRMGEVVMRDLRN